MMAVQIPTNTFHMAVLVFIVGGIVISLFCFYCFWKGYKEYKNENKILDEGNNI